jgi:hypothetical protein
MGFLAMASQKKERCLNILTVLKMRMMSPLRSRPRRWDNWVSWSTIIITALGRQRQEDHNVEANLSYIVRPCL